MTPEQISFAYFLILGSEPKNSEIIDELMVKFPNIDLLRSHLISISEIYVNKYHPMNVDIEHHPFHLPYIPVETEVSDEVLEIMFSRISNQWKELGKSEPFWSTITQLKYLKASFSDHREEFYISGQGVLDLLLTSMRRCGINHNLSKNCLELGCGVGRVTSFLSKAFPAVVAVDISHDHIQIAQEHCMKNSIDNVEFVLLNNLGELLKLSSFDVIISVITLQHNPPPVMAWILKSLLERLNRDGVAFIQIPTYRNGYIFEAQRYIENQSNDSLEMHYLPQHNIFKIIQDSSCVCLEVREDRMPGDVANILSNSFLIQKR